MRDDLRENKFKRALIAGTPQIGLWLSLTSQGETVMGLALHPLFTIPSAFALALLVPLIDMSRVARTAWSAASGIVLAAALSVAVVAGFQPAYSDVAPFDHSFPAALDDEDEDAEWRD